MSFPYPYHFAGSHTVPGCQTVAEWMTLRGPNRAVRATEAAPTLCQLPLFAASRIPTPGTLEPSREGSGQQFVDNLAVDVGEAEVAALKAIGQAGVVEAQQVENGGV